MEGDYGIGDDEVRPLYQPPESLYEAPEDTSEHEAAQTEDIQTESDNEGLAIARRRRRHKTPQQRADDLTWAVRNFRIAHAGDGLVRGKFGDLPDNFKNLEDQMKNIKRAVAQFSMEGDGINVSGSFDKGYTLGMQTPPPETQEISE